MRKKQPPPPLTHRWRFKEDGSTESVPRVDVIEKRLLDLCDMVNSESEFLQRAGRSGLRQVAEWIASGDASKFAQRLGSKKQKGVSKSHVTRALQHIQQIDDNNLNTNLVEELAKGRATRAGVELSIPKTGTVRFRCSATGKERDMKLDSIRKAISRLPPKQE